MKTILLTVVLLSVYGVHGKAQQNVVMKVLVKNQATAPYTSSAVQNIGQNSHQLTVLLADSGGTCTYAFGSTWFAGLEASYDNASWVTLGSVVSRAEFTSPYIITYAASGIYPYVRAKVGASSTFTNCAETIIYTGSIAVSNFVFAQSDLQPYSSYSTFVGDQSTTAIPSYNFNIAPFSGIGQSNRTTPITVCDTGVQKVVSAGATTAVMSAAQVPDKISICGMIITIATTGTAKLVTGTSVQNGGSANCGSATADLTPAFNLIAGTPLTIGSGLGALFNVGANKDVCLTAVTGNVSIYASWTHNIYARTY